MHNESSAFSVMEILLQDKRFDPRLPNSDGVSITGIPFLLKFYISNSNKSIEILCSFCK